MIDGEVTILGVRHPDKRLHGFVDKESDRLTNLNVVFHEQPESNPKLTEFLYWMTLKSPASAIPILFRTLGSVWKMRRGPEVSSAGTVQIKSECRIAAEKLSDEHDAELVNIGMNRVELLKQRSWISAIISWGIALVFVWSLLDSMFTGRLNIWYIAFPVMGAVAHRMLILDKIRSTRDEHMGSNIVQRLQKRESTPAVVIIGQKHVEGVGSWLGTKSIAPTCRWVANEADLLEDIHQ